MCEFLFQTLSQVFVPSVEACVIENVCKIFFDFCPKFGIIFHRIRFAELVCLIQIFVVYDALTDAKRENMTFFEGRSQGNE